MARVPLRPGEQVWRLLRTDRDGASATEIPDMAAATVRYWVRGVGTAGSERGPLWELVPTGPGEWRFGWVRPFRVVAVSHQATSLPAGRVVGDRMHAGAELPTVRGTNPWYVTVRFWWRGPAAEIEYPGHREGILGRSRALIGADWTLDTAILPATEQPDPGDQTWNEATGKRAEEAAAAVTSSLGRTVLGGLGLGALVLVYLIAKQLR